VGQSRRFPDFQVLQVADEEADHVAIDLAADFSNLEYTGPEARPLARDRWQHKFRYLTIPEVSLEACPIAGKLVFVICLPTLAGR